MQFIIEDPTTFDPAALSEELILALGSKYGIYTISGNLYGTTGEEPDPVAFQAVLDAHVANAPTREQAKLRSRIKDIRATALGWFIKNAGVSAVYDQNYEAAMLGPADNTTVLRTGKTPLAHLAAKGSRFKTPARPTGMTAEEFAAYVINENRGTAPYTAGAIKMDEIEDEYLTAVCTPVLTEQIVADFQAYCDARTV